MPFTLSSRFRDTAIPLLPLHTSQSTTRASEPSDAFGSRHMPSINASLQPSDSLLALSRESSYLQNHLQDLLDAQSEGLLAGLGAEADTASSISSQTHTPSASEAGSRTYSKPRSVLPVRQPKPKKIGLRAARRGISRTITDLSAVKATEARLLFDEVAQRNNHLFEVDRIASKSLDLRSQIESIESEPTNTRVADLKSTEHDLGRDIYQLETRLYEMRARQRHMLREISSLENSVQSNLSSYKNALQLAEQEAREYLARPPSDVSGSTARSKEGVWALPPQRRTMELVKEQWIEEQKHLDVQKERVLNEKEALDKGGKVWEDVVRAVGVVEALLQTEMKSLNQNQRTQRPEEGMANVLRRMDETEEHLRSHLHSAEQNGWNLLIVCIGAEMEALVEGQDVLKNALNSSEVHLDLNDQGTKGKGRASHSEPNSSDTGRNLVEVSEEEDDGPGPDLLVSRE